MFIQAIAAATLSACTVLGACAPAPDTVPVMPPVMPCEGTNLIIHGFDGTPGCDLTPPQVLSVMVQHPVPWSAAQADEFYSECDRVGGVVAVPRPGMVAWYCTGIDY